MDGRPISTFRLCLTGSNVLKLPDLDLEWQPGNPVPGPCHLIAWSPCRHRGQWILFCFFTQDHLTPPVTNINIQPTPSWQVVNFWRRVKWFGHLKSMPPWCPLGKVFQACGTGRRPWGRPRTHSGDYISWLAWKCLIDLPDEQGGQRGDFLLREFSAAPMNQTWISVRTWMDGWGHPALPVLAPSLDKWPVANPWKIREQSHLQKTARQLTDLNKTIKNEQVAEFTIKKNIVNNTVSDSSIIYESWIQTMKKEIFVV